MASVHPSRSTFVPPTVVEVDHMALCLESTLGELRLHRFQVEADCLGSEIAQVFEQHPFLPGVILVENGELLGMISRQCFLEYLIRPQGLELFLNQPLSVLHSYVRGKGLLLPDTMPVLVAAQQALRRSPDQQGEPIIVQSKSKTYYLLDAHELNIAYWQIRGIETQVRYERAQAQMLQSERMASLGRLVDGVAHEILDPVGFIWGNLTHVASYTDQLMSLLVAYETHLPQLPDVLIDLKEDIELDYLRHDLPHAIASIKTGAERLKKLAASLQNFCHIDEVYPKPADLHDCLDGILLLLKSRLSGEIEIVKHYGHLPPVNCYLGQLSQVFTNILTNAVNALLNQSVRQELSKQLGQDRSANATAHTITKPRITVTTQVKSLPLAPDDTTSPSRWVSIRIADNGPGLSIGQRQQVLDSFSIERRAEKETSLAVSYQIVTAKHGGKFHLRSPITIEEDRLPSEQYSETGTEFEILLPLV